MSVFVDSVVVVMFAALGVLHYRWLSKRHQDLSLMNIHERIGVVNVILIAGIIISVSSIVIGFRPEQSWQVPLGIQCYFSAMIWGPVLSSLAYVTALSALAAFREKHPERVKLLIGCCGAIVATVIFHARMTQPLYEELAETVDHEGVILQSDGSSCSAASLANIVNALGGEVTEKEAARLSGTTSLGTSVGQTCHAARKLGVGFRRGAADPARINPPAMLFVDHPATGPESHAVALMAIAEGMFEVWDPLVGKTHLTRDKLLETWHGKAIEFYATRR